MKKLFTPLCGMLAAGILCSVSLHAQSINTWNTNTEFKRCGQMEYENYLRSKDPMYDLKKEEVMKTIDAKVQEMENAKLNGNPQPFISYTIPIVVHVIWNTAAENVSDAKVTSMVAQMNMDWSRTNTDAGNTPAVWQPIAANMEIQFCLATTDPSGNPTNGIVHKNTSITDFSASGDPKFSSQGGDDAWDFTKYLNIWVADIGNGLLGYATFPPVSNTYGTVIHYCTVGSLTNPGTCAPFQYGRTLSHEIGHNFTLNHIWDGGCPANGDGVADTPGQQGPTSGCPTFPALDACQTSSPGFMFPNYMDYTNDACYNMFTAGQKTRSQSAISTYLMSIANNASLVCGPAAALDAGINSIVSPSGIACNTTFTPIVKLQNYGATTLTSCTINYNIDANPNQTFSWTGSLATAASVNVTLPSMTTTAGTHTFTSSSSSPNAGIDGNTGNDQSTSIFTVAGAAQNPPVVEGIENATFPTAGWTVNNPDVATTWARTTLAAKTGSASMFMDNFDYAANGQVDEFVSPPIDFSFATSAQVTFQVAYQLYTNPSSSPNFSDTLMVLISTDCGVTWTNVYNKFGTTLTTTTPAFSATEFVPNASQWRMETIDLTSYIPTASMLLKFRHTTDYENNMYVDDINITSVVGIEEMDISNYVSVYPNPTSGKANVLISQFRNLKMESIQIYNVYGEKVYSNEAINFQINSSSNFQIDLSSQPGGMYFVEVKTTAGSAVKKVMISK